VLRRLLDPIARRLVRRGVRQALAEGSGVWLAIGVVAAVVRLLLRPEEPQVVHEELRVGETIVVRHLPGPAQPTRRERRREARRRQPPRDASVRYVEGDEPLPLDG